MTFGKCLLYAGAAVQDVDVRPRISAQNPHADLAAVVSVKLLS